MDQTWVKLVIAAALFVGILSLIFVIPDGSPSSEDTDAVSGSLKKMSSGVEYVDQVIGKGAKVRAGMQIRVHYTGWLKTGTKADGMPIKGKKFDSSRTRGRPFPLTFGPQAGVIQGWKEGLKGMRVGGRRLLVIPSRLGYGRRGFGRTIPPNSDLVFDVEVVSGR